MLELSPGELPDSCYTWSSPSLHVTLAQTCLQLYLARLTVCVCQVFLQPCRRGPCGSHASDRRPGEIHRPAR